MAIKCICCMFCCTMFDVGFFCVLFFFSSSFSFAFVFKLHKSVNIICMHAVHWMQLIILWPPCFCYQFESFKEKKRFFFCVEKLKIRSWWSIDIGIVIEWNRMESNWKWIKMISILSWMGKHWEIICGKKHNLCSNLGI